MKEKSLRVASMGQKMTRWQPLAMLTDDNHENYGKPGDGKDNMKKSVSVENDDASGLKHEIYSFKNYTVDNTVQLCTHGKIRVKCNYR